MDRRFSKIGRTLFICAPPCRLVRALFGNRNGATAVEFGLVAAPFFALLIALFEVGLVFLTSQLLDNAASQASRLIMTGQAQTSNMTATQFTAAVCKYAGGLFDCTKLMLNVSAYNSFSTASANPPSLTFDSQGNVTNKWQFQPGAPGDIVVVQVMYQWPLITGPLGFTLANSSNGMRLLASTVSFKNEPFQ